MRDKLTIAVLIVGGGWLFANVWQLTVTAGRLEVSVSEMERRDDRTVSRLDQHALRISRLERR